MRSYKLILLLCFIGMQATAQLTNDWIDFEKTYYKIKISEKGIHNLSYQTLTNNGFPSTGWTGADLKLFREGKEIAIETSNEGVWGAQDYFEFYGYGPDGKFDERLFADPEHQLHQYCSLFNPDYAVYFLTIDLDNPNKRITPIDNDLSNPPPAEPFFWSTSLFIGKQGYSKGVSDQIQLTLTDTIPTSVSNWELPYSNGEGSIAQPFGNESTLEVDQFIDIPSPQAYITGPPASLQIKYDHILDIGIDGIMR